MAGYYLLNQHYFAIEVQVAPDTEKPLFTADNVKSTSYNEQGIRSHTLDANHIEHYQKLEKTHFNAPVLWTYNYDMAEEWRISSAFAVLENSRYLMMKENVRIFNLLPNAQIKVITTKALTLDLTSQDFWSETETKITGVGFQTRGQRIKGNFGSHQMELIEQVKSRYEPVIK
ncbi:LPS export ABC transporter periplasmic protein LptC [Candidatus Enterovibrio altilux]|nr:LPS export ABC transporter periplasmic protein LptC [Candidatus Enterovibrio luxaltus]